MGPGVGKCLIIFFCRHRVIQKCENVSICCNPSIWKKQTWYFLYQRNALFGGYGTKIMYNFGKWVLLQNVILCKAQSSDTSIKKVLKEDDW